MFDISFSELMVIAVVALLVIGPEKLPKLARTLGAYTGRMQRFVAQVKDEVNREVRFEELQKLQQEVQSATMQAESSIMAGVDAMQQGIGNAATGPAVQPKRTRKKVNNSLAADTEISSEANKSSTKTKRVVPKKQGELTLQTKPTSARKKATG